MFSQIQLMKTNYFLCHPDSLCSDCSVPPVVFKMCFWLGYCNSTVNPVIYTCSSNEFRRAFLNILCCRRLGKRTRASRCEFQMRPTDHYGYRRRAIRQKPKMGKECQHQASLPDMSSTSSSTPQNSHVAKKNSTSKMSLPRTLLSIGAVGSESISLELKGFQNMNTASSVCSNCKENSSHAYQNGISRMTGKHGSSEQGFTNSSNAFHRSFLPRKQSRVEKSHGNGTVLTQGGSADNMYRMDTLSACRGVFSHELCSDDYCRGEQQVSELCATDIIGSDDISCYSLAETVSFSE